VAVTNQPFDGFTKSQHRRTAPDLFDFLDAVRG